MCAQVSSGGRSRPAGWIRRRVVQSVSHGCGENAALATSGGDRIEAGRSATQKGSASGAAHGERAPVSWVKITVADLVVRESLTAR